MLGSEWLSASSTGVIVVAAAAAAAVVVVISIAVHAGGMQFGCLRQHLHT